MPQKVSQLLINELVRRQVITPQEVEELVAQTQQENKPLDRLLTEKSLISDEDLLQLKSEIFQLPPVNLEQYPPNKDALKEISDDVIRFYQIIPFSKEGSVLRVGIVNPDDIDALEALKFIASDKGLKLEKYVIGYREFEAILKEYGTLTGEVVKALGSFIPGELDKKEEDLRLDQITAESPVTKVVGAMLKHAVDSRASDVHIEPFEDRIRVRFRVDGVLTTTLTLARNLHSAIVTRIKILANLKIDETRLSQDGRFSLRVGDMVIDFRVSTLPTYNGEKIEMRVLDPLGSKVTLEGLGIQGGPLTALKKAMDRPYGAILITGPTGSGKSTTITGILRQINSDDINIVTLEDPIEYYIDGVNQSQIHEEIGYTFANGLRHVLRQDPDVIMVGEIRDRDTARLAIQAALTGHIVLSTLHTNDALGVIPRLIDMGIEGYLIPPTINLAIAQRLLRRLCPTCRVTVKANVAEEKIINNALTTIPEDIKKEFISSEGYTIYKPNTQQNPCKDCGGKAYKGRVGIFEALEMTEQLEQIILGSLSEASLQDEARRQGMLEMFQDGIIKVLQGLVSLQELLEVAQMQDNEVQ